MSPEEYVMNNIMIDAAPVGSTVFAIQSKIANECVDHFKRNDYGDLHEMLDQDRNKIKKYKPLIKPVTAKAYAKCMNIADSTARKWLSTMGDVRCDSSKKPFTYTLIKP